MKEEKNFIHSGFKNYYLDSKDEYLNLFISASANGTPVGEIFKNALDRAWKNRDFEIEMYWKRATYFWTFIAATLVGYTALVTSKVIIEFYQLEIILICLGFFLSVVWRLVNMSSKFWQENWEYHIDMLENYFTGPLYKTVKTGTKHSVSNLNYVVSLFMLGLWFTLGIRYFVKHITFKIPPNFTILDIDFYTIGIVLFTSLLIKLAYSKRTRTKDTDQVGFTYRNRI